MGLHVQMRDSLSNILKVEIFHVPIVGSFTGAEHLIGVREHADPGDHISSNEPNRSVQNSCSIMPPPAKAGSADDSSDSVTIRSGSHESLGRNGSEVSGSSQRGQRQLRRLRQTRPAFLTVKIDSESFTIIESSGQYSAPFLCGVSLKRIVPPGQTFFTDLAEGLRTMSHATYEFKSTLILDVEGSMLEKACSVTLSSESGSAAANPIVATVRLREETGQVSSSSEERRRPSSNLSSGDSGQMHMNSEAYLEAMMQGLPSQMMNETDPA